MQMWVADLRHSPPTSLLRCDCTGRHSCAYHSADWPLLLFVVLEEFRATYGDGPADLLEVMELVVPRIEQRLKGRRHRRSREFAQSLFVDPMLADEEQWTNGQHRCQAAMNAGCHFILFCE